MDTCFGLIIATRHSALIIVYTKCFFAELTEVRVVLTELRGELVDAFRLFRVGFPITVCVDNQVMIPTELYPRPDTRVILLIGQTPCI